MRVVNSSVAKLLHNFFTHVDDPRSLLRIQCRSNMRAEELSQNHVRKKIIIPDKKNDKFTSSRNAPAKPVPTKKKSGA